MLQDLEDKTPLLLEQKQAYETLKKNYHQLLLQWNQFCDQTLTTTEGSFTDSTKLLYTEVLRLREEVVATQRQVELLRSQRDAVRSKWLLREGVTKGEVERLCEEKKQDDGMVELMQLRETAKRMELRLQATEARRKKAETKCESLQKQVRNYERSLAEVELNSDKIRLSRLSALTMVCAIGENHD